jgi:hypothetical protein
VREFSIIPKSGYLTPALRPDPGFVAGMAKKAVIGAVMHNMTHLIYGVLYTGKPFDPNYLTSGLAIQDGI